MAPRKVSRRIVLELGSSYSDRLRNSPQRGGDGRSYPAERGEEDSFATSFFWRESPTVSLVEIRLLLEALPEPSRPIAGILVLTGLRVGELLALRWSDIDLTAKTLRVRQTVYNGVFDTPKMKRSNRVVPLSPSTVEILERQKKGSGNALIFSSGVGGPLCRNLLNRQFKPTAEKLGQKEINWHWLRYATASLLDAAGAPLGTVQTLLGHSSPEVTREHYIHAVASESRGAIDRMQNLLVGPKWTQTQTLAQKGSLLVH
jgi:integrase